MGRQTRVGLTGVLLGAGLLLPALGLQFQDVDAPPISYSDTPAVDQVARLGEKLKRGELKLTRHPERGYLDSFLQALGISPSSQLLVFSKTSFQRERISPVTPRALYFNDDVYVGWVQGGPVLEISAADPHLGGVFYVLDQESNAPRPLRQRHECLSCHESGLTGGVPGHTLRSVLSLRDGLPAFSSGAYVMTPESSFDQRWGGWYVTGSGPGLRHLGNLTFGNAMEADAPDRARGAVAGSLAPFFDTRPYPTPHSDLVAHLVATHQVHVHNLLTRASYETRRALAFEKLLNRELGRGDTRQESTTRRIRSACEPLVRALLDAGEQALPGPVGGSSGYAAWFTRQGPRDARGRSLRDLDLKTRVFRYPCSFLVYSPSFQKLPREARDYVLGRLREILSAGEPPAGFSHLTRGDRTALREILTETLPGFATAER